jgi:hypothetical protein
VQELFVFIVTFTEHLEKSEADWRRRTGHSTGRWAATNDASNLPAKNFKSSAAARTVKIWPTYSLWTLRCAYRQVKLFIRK